MQELRTIIERYAQTGRLPSNGVIKPVEVDLSQLYKPFLDRVVTLSNQWNPQTANDDQQYALAVQSEFLRYLYLPGDGFYVEGKYANDFYPWYPGRQFGSDVPGEPFGPCGLTHSDVMFITSHESAITYSENRVKTLVSMSPIAECIRLELFETLKSIGFDPDEVQRWYMTSLVKFQPPTSGVSTNKSAGYSKEEQLSAVWLKGCFPWVVQEIALLKPKYIVCVGSQVLKRFLGPTATLKKYNGRLVMYDVLMYPGAVHSCKLLGLPSFGTVIDPDVEPQWRRQLTLLYNDLNGIEQTEDFPVLHRAVRDEKMLQYHIDRIKTLAKTDPKRRIIAVDLEWEGKFPEEDGAHVLTVQFSSAPGEAIVVELNDENGVVFEQGIERAAQLLESLLTPQPDWNPRLGGHFLRADLPWLFSLGISKMGLKHAYQPAETFEACRDEGGWDTGLMYHAYRDAEETGDGYGLKVLALKECGIKPYDVQLNEELNDYEHCVSEKRRLNERLDRIKQLTNRLKAKYKRSKTLKKRYQWLIDILSASNQKTKADLKSLPNKRTAKGFGCISSKTLKKYAAWDADATRRLAELCLYGLNGRKALLDDDGYGNSCFEPFWRAHRASWGFLEMEQTGFVLDVDRLNSLSHLFNESYHIMLSQFREEHNWDGFNPNSADQRRGLLFGREFSKMKSGAYAMPEGAKSFNLTPIRATDKTAWESIDEEETEHYSASTDSLSVSIFAQEHEDVRFFKDICKLSRTLAGNIRPPIDTVNSDGSVTTTWDKGIYTFLRPNGRVHTRLSQTKKTGRASSSDPPMQNIGKSAEALLQTTLGYTDSDGEVFASYPELFPEPRYLYPCRTILRAAPGNVLIESDFTGAELAVMAWASGDKNMIEHVRRNALPEDDPDYYDIHSHIAVRAFHLDCEPTKKGLASIHKKHLRVAAKAVVFGIPYGRGVKAILLQCQSDGVYLSQEEGEELLNSYFRMYPATEGFLRNCRQAVEEKGFVKTLFNRCRRFSRNLPERELAKAQREACNAPIQGTVADSINNAIFNFTQYQEQHPELPFSINMQIHDALVFEIRASLVQSFKSVITRCMVENNPVVVNGVPHHFGLDSSYYVNWGEELTDEIAQRELGMSLADILG